MLGRGAALLDRVSNQTHAPEFAGDVEAWNIGFVIPRDARDVHAASLRAKDQRDRPVWTDRFTFTVSNAVGRPDQSWSVIDKFEDIVFRAGTGAGAATDTSGRIELRVQAHGYSGAGL